MSLPLLDVVVIGGGVMGSATAHACASRGLSVTLLERSALGHAGGSSHGPSRIVRRTYPSPLFTRLMARAYALWAALSAEAGEALLQAVGGGVDIASRGSAALAALRAACAEAGVPIEPLTAAALRARFGVLLREDEEAVFQADTCIVDASACTRTLQRLARARGAELREHVEVHAVRALGGAEGGTGAYEVHIADAAPLRARAVVVCAGPWTGPLLRRLFGVSLRLDVWQCTTVFFEHRQREPAAAPALPVLIHYGSAAREHGDEVYSCPCPGQPWRAKFAMHSGVACAADTRDGIPASGAALAPLQEWLRARAPAFDAEAPRDASTCLYTMTADDAFVIDAVPGHARVFVAGGFSGHGFKFAPLVGAMMAALVQTGSVAAAGVDAAAVSAAFSIRRPALEMQLLPLVEPA